MARKFRRRRRFGGPVKRKSPIWIAAAYDEPVNDALAVPGQPLGTFIEIFELVSWQDYTDETGLVGNRRETASVQRVMGQCAMDIVASVDESNAVSWAGAIIVAGDEAITNMFAADNSVLVLHDVGIFEQNISRLNVMQWQPTTGYRAVFNINTVVGLQNAWAPSVLGLQPQDGRAFEWRFDFTGKRKLRTDESLWLLVSGFVEKTTAAFDLGAFVRTEARTIIYDD